MRTLQEMLEAEKNRVKAPTMRFKDFCQYVYKPLLTMEEANLNPDQKQEMLTDISRRLGNKINPTWPPNYKKTSEPS
jgi:hypothetical protein